MANNDKCPICGIKECEIKMNPGPEDFYLVSCKRCGKYSLSDTAFLSDLSEIGSRHLLSGAVRNRYENGEKLYFSAEDFKSILDTVKIPSTSEESINLLLKHIFNKLKNPADTVKFTPFYDFPLLYAERPDEFEYYLEQALKLKYVEFDNISKGYRLTLEGRQKLEKLSKEEPVATKKGILVFISYSTKDKNIVGKIKQQLEQYELNVFVGHDDINPSSEWVKEILKNLENCDIFIPYLTENFKKSKWTDQESGMAEILRKCVLPLKIKYDPYGFISKYQALDISNKDSNSYGYEILKRIITSKEFPKLQDIIIEKFIDSRGYVETGNIWDILFLFEKLSEEQINLIVKAYLENDQISGYYHSRSNLKELLGRNKMKINNRLYKELNAKLKFKAGNV